MSAGARPERYAGGYGPLAVDLLGHRRLARDGAFFIPHLARDMTILDCGCGPGALTLDLAAIASSGRVVGIDIEPRQVQAARDRARQRQCENVRFEASDMYALPFEDGTFDAVFAHAVLYHLARPLDALAEVRRVLRPGGLLGLRDADMGGDLYAPASPLLDEGWSLIARVFEHGGAAMRFGRTHRAVLRAAGFERAQASASYDYVGTPAAARQCAGFWTHFLGELHAAVVLSEGWISRARLDEVLVALRAWGEHPDAFHARCRCEAIGWKGG